MSPHKSPLPPNHTLLAGVESIEVKSTEADSQTAHIGRRVLINTVSLTGSSLWRIVLSFILQLVIARRMGFDVLGQYTVALAYLNVSQVVSELGLQALLVRDLAHRPEQRRSFFWIALCVQSAAALVIWLGLFLLTQLFAFDDSLRLSLWIVGASLIFYAITSVCETLFQAGERMEFVLGIEAAINILIFGLSLVLIVRETTIVQLVAVWFIAQILSALLCLFLLRRSQLLSGPQESAAVSPTELWQKTFPFFLLSLGDVLLQRADILLLSIFGNDAITGIYSVAYNVVRVLLRMIQSFWRALYPTLSRLHRTVPQRFEQLSEYGFWYGMILVLLGCVVGTSAAEGFLPMVFGEDANASVPVFRLLLWLAPVFFLESYAIMILMVARQPRLSLQLICIHLLFLAIGIPTVLWNGMAALGVAIAVLGASGVGMLFGILLLRRVDIPLLKERAIIHLAFALVASLSSAVLPVSWEGRSVAGALIYLGALWLLGAISRSDWDVIRRVL